MKKLIYILVIAVLSIGNVWGQNIKTVARFETNLNDGLREEHIFKHNSGNFAILRSSERSEGGEMTFIFTKYNSKLEEQSIEEIKISKKFRIYAKVENGELFHVMFIRDFNKQDFIIGTYNIMNNKVKITDGTLPKKFHFDYSLSGNKGSYLNASVLGNNLLVKGRIKKNPMIFSIDMENGNYTDFVLTINGVKPKKTNLVTFVNLPETNEFACMVTAQMSHRVMADYVYVFNNKSELIHSVEMKDKSNIFMLSMTGAKISDSKYVFTGAYTKTYVPEGIYIVTTNGSEVLKSNFVGYTKLQNFFKFVSEKAAAKIEKRKEKLESKGKEMVYNNFITIHPLMILSDNEFLFLGEFYTPQYHTETTGTGNNRSTRRVFDGNAYSEAVCVKFDDNANVIWDNLIRLNPGYWPMTENKFVTVKLDDKNISLLYSERNSIHSNVLDYEGRTKVDEIKQMITEANENEEVKKTMGVIEYWYDNYFIQYGIQKLKEQDGGLFAKRRLVYFINKLEY